MSRETDQSVKRRAIALLAKDSKLPLAHIAQLYEHEHARLAAGAHVKQYLPIFTIRNVREQLLQQHAAQAVSEGVLKPP